MGRARLELEFEFLSLLEWIVLTELEKCSLFPHGQAYRETYYQCEEKYASDGGEDEIFALLPLRCVVVPIEA